MAHLARIVRLDESDDRVFAEPAEMGEWAISGAFEFSNWAAEDLVGQRRQAFTNGWLGLDTFGRASVIAVTPVTEAELETLTDQLAAHFVARYGAPNVAAARPVAEEEMRHALDLCNEHPPNTLLLVERSLEDVGVRERYRAVAPQAASLDSFAVHGE